MLLQSLQRQGYIRSVENVFEHASEKFTQRLGFIHLDKNEVNSEEYWGEVKKEQKKKLKKEHQKYLKDISHN